VVLSAVLFVSCSLLTFIPVNLPNLSPVIAVNMLSHTLITVLGFLLVSSIASPAVADDSVTISCFWQDGSDAGDYNVPCSYGDGDAFVCCNSGTECLSTGFRQLLGITKPVITQGACSDPTWKSSSCQASCPCKFYKP